MKKTIHVLAAGVLLVALSGCSKSAEDRAYDIFRCGKAATMLGDRASASNAIAQLESIPEIANMSENKARYAMLMGQRFQDDYPLYQYSPGRQLAVLQKIYSSDACLKLYISGR